MGFDRDGEPTYIPSGDDTFVCAKCVNSKGLEAIVNANLEDTACSYCNAKSDTNIAAPLETVVDHMASCITRAYTDPANELPYEGGYVGDVMDAYDLLEDVGFSVDSGELFDDVVHAFMDHDWCRRDYFRATDLERLEWCWRDFQRVVKHERRFTFWELGPDEDDFAEEEIGVGKILSTIGTSVRSAGLIVTLPVGTPFWRVRVHKDAEVIEHDHQLSPPPRDRAKQSNRMSPAGVPMFYGAHDFETAAIETVDLRRRKGRTVTGAAFCSLREFRILDLTKLPYVPDFFDESGDDVRETISFLHAFVRDVSKPIQKDDSEHVEYAPTQAFTEYVRFQLDAEPDEGKKRFDGICYRSSRNSQPCYVLFFEQKHCTDDRSTAYGAEQALRLDATTLRHEPLPAFAPILRKLARPPRRRVRRPKT